ncbi:MAG: SGNH/GDSL hydrolase family protein [Pseudomonadota bacterium]
MKTFFSVITAVAISLFVSLTLSEMFVRAFAPPWLEQRMSILAPATANFSGFGTDRNWKVERKNGKFVSFTPHSQFNVSHVEYLNVANIDRFGGRRTFPSYGALPRVIVLGDSFTFGVGVEDHETVVSQMAIKVPGATFLNLGVPGSALPQQLEIVKERHAELASNLYVFFFFLGNDFADILQYDLASSKGGSAKETNSPQSNPNDGVLWKVNDFIYHHPLLRHSYLIQLLRKFSLDALSVAYPGAVPPSDPILIMMDGSKVEYHDKAMTAIIRQLRALLDAQDRLGFRSLLIAIPDRQQLSPSIREFQAQIHSVPLALLDPFRPNQLLRTAAASVGIPFFDPTQCISAAGYKIEELYYHQDSHFRALGYETLANCVVEYVARSFALSGQR